MAEYTWASLFFFIFYGKNDMSFTLYFFFFEQIADDAWATLLRFWRPEVTKKLRLLCFRPTEPHSQPYFDIKKNTLNILESIFMALNNSKIRMKTHVNLKLKLFLSLHLSS